MQFQSALPARKSAVFHSKKRQRLQHLAGVEEGMSIVAPTCIIKSEYQKDALAQVLVSPVLKLMQRNKLIYMRSSKSVFLRSLPDPDVCDVLQTPAEMPVLTEAWSRG